MPRTKEVFQQVRDISKQNILDKAAEVFTNKGLANTKVSDLAKAAGVSQGLLYWYFPGKEDVFAALLERAVNNMINLTQTVINGPGTPWEKLCYLTEQFLGGIAQEPKYYQIFSQAQALSGKVQEIIDRLDVVGDSLQQLIAEGQTKGQIVKGDPEKLTLLYLSCLYGLAATMGFPRKPPIEHFPDAETVLNIFKP